MATRIPKTKSTARTGVSDSLTTATASMIGSSQPGINYTYYAPVVNYQEFYNVYDTSPLAQLLINTLPEDTVSEWREWQADDDQVNAIEALEKKLQLRKAIKDWQVFGAIEGEAIIYFDDGTDATQPIDVTRARRDSLRFVRVFRRALYTYGSLITDPMSEWYDQPEYYTLNTNDASMTVQIHPSRVARWINNPSPSRENGLSSLVAGLNSIKQYESVIANSGFLVQKARTTIMGVEGLMDNVSDPVTEAAIIARYALFRQQEGVQGMGVIDKDKEEFAALSYTFGGLDSILQRMQQHVASMWGYPVTRIFDRVESGLGNTGNSSLKAYYQSVGRRQDNQIQPMIAALDELLIRSALGDYPDGVYYNWRPLETPDQKSIQEIGKIAADTLKIAVDANFMSTEVAGKAFINRLSETGCFPGVEIAYDEWIDAGGDLQADEGDVIQGSAASPEAKSVTDSAPMTLYVSRKVINAAEIIKWAKDQGFKETLSESDLHVTIAYSRTAMDWMSIGEPWNSKIEIAEGGPRLTEKFGDAKVILFKSSDLEWRHKSIIDAGASWDHAEYQPHITISYGDMPNVIKPYTGKIILGPEIFEEVNEDWRSVDD